VVNFKIPTFMHRLLNTLPTLAVSVRSQRIHLVLAPFGQHVFI